jgi:hypothetical protein
MWLQICEPVYNVWLCRITEVELATHSSAGELYQVQVVDVFKWW